MALTIFFRPHLFRQKMRFSANNGKDEFVLGWFIAVAANVLITVKQLMLKYNSYGKIIYKIIYSKIIRFSHRNDSCQFG